MDTVEVPLRISVNDLTRIKWDSDGVAGGMPVLNCAFDLKIPISCLVTAILEFQTKSECGVRPNGDWPIQPLPLPEKQQKALDAANAEAMAMQMFGPPPGLTHPSGMKPAVGPGPAASAAATPPAAVDSLNHMRARSKNWAAEGSEMEEGGAGNVAPTHSAAWETPVSDAERLTVDNNAAKNKWVQPEDQNWPRLSNLVPLNDFIPTPIPVPSLGREGRYKQLGPKIKTGAAGQDSTPPAASTLPTATASASGFSASASSSSSVLPAGVPAGTRRPTAKAAGPTPVANNRAVTGAASSSGLSPVFIPGAIEGAAQATANAAANLMGTPSVMASRPTPAANSNGATGVVGSSTSSTRAKTPTAAAVRRTPAPVGALPPGLFTPGAAPRASSLGA